MLEKNFFIVGCPRSGTTLLSVLLDRHSRIAIPPETAFFDEVAPHFPINVHALGRLLAGWPRLSELGLTVDEISRDSSSFLSPQSLLSTILAIFGEKNKAKCVGEKTPQHLNHVEAIMQFFPDARVLCLMRDGRDVALSLAAMPWWLGGLHGAAEMWLKAEARSAALAERYRERFMTIGYEKLLMNPYEMVASATAFVGETFEMTQLDHTIPSGVVLPRSLKWKGDALKPLTTALLQHRRFQISESELIRLDRHLENGLRQRGYPPLELYRSRE